MPTKMKFHFRPKTKVTCACITELSYGSVANITFSANANDIFGMKTKNKTKKKIHFRPKTKKSRKWPNSPFSALKTKTNFGRLFCLMAWPEWPWRPPILRQIYATESDNEVQCSVMSALTVFRRIIYGAGISACRDPTASFALIT